jgi:hypothetical protein
MNKKIVYVIVGAIVLVGVFYGGMLYGKGQNQTPANGTGGATFAGARTRGAGSFGGATVGQIISEDSSSITVALPAGGSKIVFLDNTTPITKQASGKMSDLTIGTNVSVVGTANTDGSVSAQAIQIRPNMGANGATPIKQ